MIINGINYCVALYEIDDDGFPEYKAHFEDFYKLNAFIKENAEAPQYLSNQMCYSFVEIIDGEPTAFSWVQNIQWCEFSDEQIQKEISDFIETEEELNAHFEKADELSREIHYYAEDVDYRKKQVHFKDLSYVCPHCIRNVEDCRCSLYPYYLVQIDKLMVPIVRELNSKGYRTTGCCAGHLDEDEFKTTGIYIAFAEDYDFDEPFPQGGKYIKTKHAIQYVPSVEDHDNLSAFQSETLAKLEDWAEMLFDVNVGEEDT